MITREAYLTFGAYCIDIYDYKYALTKRNRLYLCNEVVGLILKTEDLPNNIKISLDIKPFDGWQEWFEVNTYNDETTWVTSSGAVGEGTYKVMEEDLLQLMGRSYVEKIYIRIESI